MDVEDISVSGNTNQSSRSKLEKLFDFSKKVNFTSSLNQLDKGSTPEEVFEKFPHELRCINAVSFYMIQNRTSKLESQQAERVTATSTDISKKRIRDHQIEGIISQWNDKEVVSLYQNLLKNNFRKGVFHSKSMARQFSRWYEDYLQTDEDDSVQGAYMSHDNSKINSLKSIIDSLDNQRKFFLADFIIMMKKTFVAERTYTDAQLRNWVDVYHEFLDPLNNLGNVDQGKKILKMVLQTFLEVDLKIKESLRDFQQDIGDVPNARDLTVKEIFMILKKHGDFDPPESMTQYHSIRKVAHQDVHLRNPGFWFDSFDANVMLHLTNLSNSDCILVDENLNLNTADIAEFYKRMAFKTCGGAVISPETILLLSAWHQTQSGNKEELLENALHTLPANNRYVLADIFFTYFKLTQINESYKDYDKVVTEFTIYPILVGNYLASKAFYDLERNSSVGDVAKIVLQVRYVLDELKEMFELWMRN